VLLLILATLLAVGCSGSPKKPIDPVAVGPRAPAPPEPETTTTTTAPTTTIPTYPLSGRPATDAGRADRAAVAVKVDNIAEARPQAGLGEADVIYRSSPRG